MGLIALLIGLTALYGIGVAIAWDPHPGDWHIWLRTPLVVLLAGYSLILLNTVLEDL